MQPFKLDEVKATLQRLGIERFTLSHVLDHDPLLVTKSFYRGTEYRVETPKVKLETIVSADRVEEVIEELSYTLRTAACDDGAILIYEVADAIRIRTGQRLQYALA